MNIETNRRGRLRNTTLPKSKGLLPLFEALINSIHALEEAQIPPEQGLIRVVIERASTKKSYEAYIEVISFGRLVNMAQERNRAFFDKLGLPAS